MTILVCDDDKEIVEAIDLPDAGGLRRGEGLRRHTGG